MEPIGNKNRADEPIRVLHVISCLNPGGIECWLMNLLRLRRPEVQFEFLTFHEGQFDKEARELGATVHRLPYRRPAVVRHRAEIEAIIAEGRYDVVHYHMSSFSGMVMEIAAKHGVPVRIDHVHSTAWGNPKSLGYWIHSCYQNWGNLSNVDRYATHLLACSNEAGEKKFGRLWEKRKPDKMVYCGISVNDYRTEFDEQTRQKLLRKFDFPEDAIVIGSVGNLRYPKNYEFLIAVFAELAKRDKRYVLLIAGEGDQRNKLEQLIELQGLSDRVRLPGRCSNVPELLCQLYDIFCLPSRYEGFGLVFLEATAAGLHSVCSNVITRDIIDCIPEQCTPLSLTDPVSVWCDAVEEGLRRKKSPREGVERVEKTPFAIENSMDRLIEIYSSSQNR